jgi:predicted TIM-barrel fold metal-dependent hydrolase
MCALQTVGADRLLFGSDAPPLLSLLPKAKKIIEDLPIGASEKEAILGKNALKLLKRT